MAWTSNFRHLHNGVDIYEKFYGKLSVQKRARYNVKTEVIQAIFVTINSGILKQQRNGETNVNINRHDTGSLKFVLFTSSRLSNV